MLIKEILVEVTERYYSSLIYCQGRKQMICIGDKTGSNTLKWNVNFHSLSEMQSGNLYENLKSVFVLTVLILKIYSGKSSHKFVNKTIYCRTTHKNWK